MTTELAPSLRPTRVERPLETAWAARLVGLSWRKGSQCKVRVREAWVEAPLGAWVVAYRLVNQSGEPVVAELRVFPCEPGKGRPPGRWSAEVLGVDASAPPGGIPADLLRHVRVTLFRSVAADFLRWLEQQPDQAAAKPTKADDAERLAPAAERGRPDEFYAYLAKEYVDLLNTEIGRAHV